LKIDSVEKGKQNFKKLKKFMKKNKKDINLMLDSYVDLFNKCGEETRQGEIQVGFAGAVLTSMLKVMANISKDEKLLLIDKMREHIEKQ